MKSSLYVFFFVGGKKILLLSIKTIDSLQISNLRANGSRNQVILFLSTICWFNVMQY